MVTMVLVALVVLVALLVVAVVRDPHELIELGIAAMARIERWATRKN